MAEARLDVTSGCAKQALQSVAETRRSVGALSTLLSPLRGLHLFPPCPHGLRRGLHSFAAPRLEVGTFCSTRFLQNRVLTHTLRACSLPHFDPSAVSYGLTHLVIQPQRFNLSCGLGNSVVRDEALAQRLKRLRKKSIRGHLRGSRICVRTSVVPTGLVLISHSYPGLTSWAVICRPFGAGLRSISTHSVTRNLVLTHTLKPAKKRCDLSQR